MLKTSRVKHELQLLQQLLPQDIICKPINDSLCEFKASIVGPPASPYADGVFDIEVRLSDRYPFQPPLVKFATPIYHPNIDQSGRICLDQLKMPPAGCWSPSLNIASVLIAVKQLINEANPDDGLMADISAQYKSDRTEFNAVARQWTIKHAIAKVR
ncbi:uncharacterized protein TRIADDRAFT_30629 [Trichoplax adhaerens]|uniref:Ubiquitin-conjugating enzyme E2 T n=1 Tax=Trichoplax adhaerens TaxID=10228 RepID=B3S7K5_TRIAD|nr:hypothetical protein TRIADDRAFT_30629 [Trichoplax adhaerens]EDV21212.1 hypothetical protein TRIADDRAFT_30629 [Trichoplax adhaerens]|eukprot:XP_002116179.1 hypothetical protein TRIADDRAFT_30629 [Trichoplax adhaerens]